MSERVVRPSWLSDVSVIVSHEFISGQTQHLRPGKGKKKKKRNRKKWSEFPGGLMGDNGGLIVMWSRTDLMWENGKAEGRDSICWEKQTCIAAFRSFFLSSSFFFATSLRYDAVQFSFTFPLLLLSFFLCFFKRSWFIHVVLLPYILPASFPSYLILLDSFFSLFSFVFFSLIALCFLVFSSVFLQIINYFSWTLLHSPVILSFSQSFPVHLFDASHFSPFLLFLDSILVSCFSLVLFHKPFS